MEEETSEDRMKEVTERKNSAVKLGKGSRSLDAPVDACNSSSPSSQPENCSFLLFFFCFLSFLTFYYPRWKSEDYFAMI